MNRKKERKKRSDTSLTLIPNGEINLQLLSKSDDSVDRTDHSQDTPASEHKPKMILI